MYTLWLPFELQPGNRFDLSSSQPFDICGYQAEIVTELGHTGLRLKGLPDEDTALSLLPRLSAAFLYAVIGQGKPIRYDWTPVPLIFRDGDPLIYWQMSDIWPDPVPFNASRAAVYPSAKRLTNCRVTVRDEGWSRPDQFVKALVAGMALPGLREGVTDRKIALAGELYCLSGFEASDRAIFLTLWTALEVLAPTTRRSSIRASLSKHVHDILFRDGKFPAEKSSAELTRLYALRSRIIHGGSDVHHEDLFKLEELVRITLLATLRLHRVPRSTA